VRQFSALSLIALAVAACTPAAGSGQADAAQGETDAGAVSEPDVGAPMDAGPADAASAAVPVDAGFGLDASQEFYPDAGAPDAQVKAGLDAALVDAAIPIDAGSFDAGPLDTVVTVNLARPGAAIPDDFLGISVEWSHVPDYLGDTTGQPRSQVIQLLRQFAADGHHPVLRIGGDSEDQAWWNPTGLPDPSGVKVDIGDQHLSILAAISTATGSRYILGLNLARLDPASAADLVTAALGALPSGSIEAFELGNEPDLYFYPSGYRQFWYSPASYQSDYDSYFPQLSTAASDKALFAGPTLYGTGWYSSLGSFLSAENGRLSLVTMHRYPFSSCLAPVSTPTIDSLFSDVATTQYATVFQPIVQTVSQAGLGLRIAEMNSVSCGGTPGVSDVFAAGLWGADAMFELASIGAVGVNFHTPSHYAVFDFDSSGALEVRGLYYAMLLFSRATAQQGRWLPIVVQSSLQVRAWGTLGSDGNVRLAIVNEDLQHSATVGVAMAQRTAPAMAWRLTASAIDTATDIAFGAETFQGSTDGNPIGSDLGDPVGWYSGQYRVTLSAGSAALLVIPQ
jgi:hypothetical protein